MRGQRNGLGEILTNAIRRMAFRAELLVQPRMKSMFETSKSDACVEAAVAEDAVRDGAMTAIRAESLAIRTRHGEAACTRDRPDHTARMMDLNKAIQSLRQVSVRTR